MLHIILETVTGVPNRILLVTADEKEADIKFRHLWSEELDVDPYAGDLFDLINSAMLNDDETEYHQFSFAFEHNAEAFRTIYKIAQALARQAAAENSVEGNIKHRATYAAYNLLLAAWALEQNPDAEVPELRYVREKLQIAIQDAELALDTTDTEIDERRTTYPN